jgi:uncharacterized membrane protein YuzA (DUF378 family)
MMKDCGSGVHMVAWGLTLVGALNWGLVGLGMLVGGSNWNLVNLLVGSWPVVESVVYLLVGVSAVFSLVASGMSCKK